MKLSTRFSGDNNKEDISNHRCYFNVIFHIYDHSRCWDFILKVCTVRVAAHCRGLDGRTEPWVSGLSAHSAQWKQPAWIQDITAFLSCFFSLTLVYVSVPHSWNLKCISILSSSLRGPNSEVEFKWGVSPGCRVDHRLLPEEPDMKSLLFVTLCLSTCPLTVSHSSSGQRVIHVEK